MNRNVRIIVGCLVAAYLLLLVPSCATAPGRGINLETARRTLQTQFPDLLRTFDLHQGIFSVNQAVWDSLSRTHRREFLDRCLQSRRAITGQTTVWVQIDGDLAAVYDETSSVFYGNRLADDDEPAAELSGGTDSAAIGSQQFPVLLTLPRPVYPAEALLAGIEGIVNLQARVGSDGRVREVMPVDGGIPSLNGAALDAARKARFCPLLGGKESASIWVRIPMRFAIQAARKPFAPGRRGGAGGIVDAMILPESDRSFSIGTGK